MLQNGYFCALANRVGREDQLEFSGESLITNPEGKGIDVVFVTPDKKIKKIDVTREQKISK